MANLQNVLNAAKSQKQSSQNIQPQQNRQQVQRMQEAIRSSSIDSLDEMVFGAPDESLLDLTRYEMMPDGQKREVYDPQREMDELKKGVLANSGKSKLPTAILESIVNDPLIMTPMTESTDSVMSENLQNRTQDIIEKLEANDRKANGYVQQDRTSINENYVPQQPTFDMQQLAQIIEGIVDKKFQQYGKTMINESRQPSTPKLGIMTLGDNFKFMDDAGNVYECTMKFVGKGKVNKK